MLIKKLPLHFKYCLCKLLRIFINTFILSSLFLHQITIIIQVRDSAAVVRESDPGHHGVLRQPLVLVPLQGHRLPHQVATRAVNNTSQNFNNILEGSTLTTTSCLGSGTASTRHTATAGPRPGPGATSTSWTLPPVILSSHWFNHCNTEL